MARHPGRELSEGRKVPVELCRQILAEESTRLHASLGAVAFEAGRFTAAAKLLDDITTAPQFATFLTLAAYRELE
ncbi:MAG: hypothetical protein ACKOCF_02345 [Gammaproteobacteria bacterium]